MGENHAIEITYPVRKVKDELVTLDRPSDGLARKRIPIGR